MDFPLPLKINPLASASKLKVTPLSDSNKIPPDFSARFGPIPLNVNKYSCSAFLK